VRKKTSFEEILRLMPLSGPFAESNLFFIKNKLVQAFFLSCSLTLKPIRKILILVSRISPIKVMG
jgi:hypothetical protein